MTMRWTEEQLKAFTDRAARPVPAPKPSKYGNHKVEADGKTFDSKKEYGRWLLLRMAEEVGTITNLQHQPRFTIEVNGQKICTYEADFCYRDDAGVLRVEDVKSVATRKLPVYRLKVKLMRAVLGIRVEEVM